MPALDLPANPALPGDVVVRVVPLRLSDLSTNALDAWDRLAARAADPNPFFRREFVQAASTSYGKDPLLLVAATGSEWIFCLPVYPVPRWRRLAVPCLAPWMPDVTYLSNPLVDADYVEEAGRAPIRYAEWQRGALHRRAEPTYVEEAMSAKRRKELRRLRRALGRDLGGEVELVDRSDDPSACDEFLRL